MRVEGRHVLVTGGAGFIGSNLVDRLLEDGARVRVMDDLSTGTERNLARARELGAEIRVADITDPEATAEAMRGIDIVAHLACSSSEAYGTAQAEVMSEDHITQPTTVYGASKLAGEWYTMAYWRTHGLP